MNSRGPISQRQFLYVGYTHLEWLLVPPGPQHTTQLLEIANEIQNIFYRTYAIYFYLSPAALFLFPLSFSLVTISHSCTFFYILSYSPLIMHRYRRWEMKKEIAFYRTFYLFLVVSFWSSLSLPVSLDRQTDRSFDIIRIA